MTPIGRFVANNRRLPLLRYIARKCARFVEVYENGNNYDFETNGEYQLLRNLAPLDAKCVFDVGANVGDWALFASRTFPNATVHCFEVMPATAAKLRENVGHSDKILINEFGLSSEPGEVTLTTYGDMSELTSLLEVGHNLETGSASGRVETGDGYCAENGIEHIDFLKVDTEAAEHLVFKGFEGMLSGQRIDVIQFEYGSGSLISKYMLKDYHALLEGHGYAVGKMYPTHVELRPYDVRYEDFLGPNMIAVLDKREDIKKRIG